MKIAFLRHGPTEWNGLGRIQGHTDIPLSIEGYEKMRGLRPDFEAARIFASPLLRARQTAQAMGLDEPRLDARLMEQNWGRWEGLTRAQILERDGPDAFARAGLKHAFRPPGGESTAELHHRVMAFLKDVARQDSDVLAIAHLGVLRAAYTLATGWEMDEPMPRDLDVAKMLVVEMRDGNDPTLSALNLALRTA